MYQSPLVIVSDHYLTAVNVRGVGLCDRQRQVVWMADCLCMLFIRRQQSIQRNVDDPSVVYHHSRIAVVPIDAANVAIHTPLVRPDYADAITNFGLRVDLAAAMRTRTHVPRLLCHSRYSLHSSRAASSAAIRSSSSSSASMDPSRPS